MSTIYAKYASGSCDNCNKDISINNKIPAFIINPYENLSNIHLFLCEECARQIKNDYVIERYFQLVDEAKEREVQKNESKRVC